ncbi:hypothetical protein HDU97_007235 [Phlyctochytrium planicorne]|nr:hypothetical protein HDU97_007235 [Phlyctochytrium planicorne]
MENALLPEEILLRIIEFTPSLTLIRDIESLCRQSYQLVRSSDAAIFKKLVEFRSMEKHGRKILPCKTASESWRDLLRVSVGWEGLPEDIFATAVRHEAHTVMSSHLPPPPSNHPWDNRRILAAVNVVGCTSDPFVMPVKVYREDGDDEHVEDSSTTVVAHFLQTPPHSGTGEILALALNDLRPKLTKVIALSIFSYAPLADGIVRPNGKNLLPVRIMDDSMSLWVEIMDTSFRRVALIEGPGGVNALRRMRNPGVGVVVGDYYGMICEVTGTLQLWFVGDSKELEQEPDLKKASRKRLRWIKGYVGTDHYIDAPAMNEVFLAAQKNSGNIELWWLDGTSYGTIKRDALEKHDFIVLTRFHLLVVQRPTSEIPTTLHCYSLHSLACLWSLPTQAKPDHDFNPEKVKISEDETCLMLSDGLNMLCVDIQTREASWFSIPSDNDNGGEFDPWDGFWIVYSDSKEEKRSGSREVAAVWRYV